MNTNFGKMKIDTWEAFLQCVSNEYLQPFVYVERNEKKKK